MALRSSTPSEPKSRAVERHRTQRTVAAAHTLSNVVVTTRSGSGRGRSHKISPHKVYALDGKNRHVMADPATAQEEWTKARARPAQPTATRSKARAGSKAGARQQFALLADLAFLARRGAVRPLRLLPKLAAATRPALRTSLWPWVRQLAGGGEGSYPLDRELAAVHQALDFLGRLAELCVSPALLARLPKGSRMAYIFFSDLQVTTAGRWGCLQLINKDSVATARVFQTADRYWSVKVGCAPAPVSVLPAAATLQPAQAGQAGRRSTTRGLVEAAASSPAPKRKLLGREEKALRDTPVKRARPARQPATPPAAEARSKRPRSGRSSPATPARQAATSPVASGGRASRASTQRAAAAPVRRPAAPQGGDGGARQLRGAAAAAATAAVRSPASPPRAVKRRRGEEAPAPPSGPAGLRKRLRTAAAATSAPRRQSARLSLGAAGEESLPMQLFTAGSAERRGGASRVLSSPAAVTPERQPGLPGRRSSLRSSAPAVVPAAEQPETDVLERVHRIVCWLAHGPPLEDGMVVDHKCSNKGCLTANHLQWVSHQENCQLGVSRRKRKH
jgi:hypothetical protein